MNEEETTNRDGEPSLRLSQPIPAGGTGGAPELQTQWESLMDQVWRCEAEARLDDRIDLAARLDRRRT
jgi:hypothetical protein